MGGWWKASASDVHDVVGGRYIALELVGGGEVPSEISLWMALGLCLLRMRWVDGWLGVGVGIRSIRLDFK